MGKSRCRPARLAVPSTAPHNRDVAERNDGCDSGDDLQAFQVEPFDAVIQNALGFAGGTASGDWLTGERSPNFFGIAFSPDGTTLASGGVDTTIKLWRVSDGSKLLNPIEEKK